MHLQRDFLKQSLAATRWEEKTGQNPRSERLQMTAKGYTPESTVRRQRCPGWEETRKGNGQSCGSGTGASKDRGEPQKMQEWAGKTGPLPLGARWAEGGLALQAVSVDCRMPAVDPQTLGGHDRESYNDWKTKCRSTPAPQRTVLMKSVTAAVIISSMVSLY